MQDLSLHILDVAENGINAGADLIRIMIEEYTERDELTLVIEDNGRGMADDFLARALDPFVTTRTTRKVGLGLSLLQQTAREAEGDIQVESSLGKGTKVRAWMKRSHIDRRPMGDMVETMLNLIQGNPEVDFVYEHMKDDRGYKLETASIRAELEEIPLNNPEVIKLIREDLDDGINGFVLAH